MASTEETGSVTLNAAAQKDVDDVARVALDADVIYNTWKKCRNYLGAGLFLFAIGAYIVSTM